MSRKKGFISFVAFVFLAGLSAACVQILGIDSTTVSDADSGASDASGDVTTDGASVDAGAFACVGNEPSQASPPSQITFVANIVDFFTGNPAPGLSVVVCPRAQDTGCANQLGPYTSDDGGVATVSIPLDTAGFQGYFEVTGNVTVSDADGGSHVETTVPYLWYFYRPLVVGGTYPLSVFATSEFAQLLSAVGATNDPTRGQLAVQVTDCSNTPAANVELVTSSTDSASTPFAILGALPVEPPAGQVPTTDVSGLAGVFNLPAKTATVTATPIALGKPSGTLTMLVKAGWLTTLRLQPNL